MASPLSGDGSPRRTIVVVSSWRFSPESMIECALEGASAEDVDAGALAELLGLLYQTSLSAEEGRAIRLATLLVPEGTSFPLLARFSDRPALTVQRLRKLGPAYDPSHSVLLVEQGPSLTLSGIASRWMVSSLAQVPRASWLAEVRGVAELHLRHARGEAVFAKSAYYRPDDPADLAPLIPSLLADRLAADVVPVARELAEELASEEGAEGATWVLHPQPETVVRRELARLLRELALDVRRQGTGGAFLVLPDDDLDLGEVVDSLHRFEAEGAGPGREAWAGSVAEALALRLVAAHTRSRRGTHEDPHLHRLLETDAGAADEIQRTACLARIDGAVILGHRLEPLAVGAKLRTDTYDTLPLELTRWLLETEKGTRHKSAACAVAAAPGSLGLVVSADGEITLVANPEGEAIRTREVRA